MINFFKKNILPLAILLLGIILLVLAMVNKNSNANFEITPQEMLANFDEFEHVTSSQAQQMKSDTNAYVFVDLRSPYDYEVSHIENAINLPTAFLLDDESKELLASYQKAEKNIVLYAQTERESISPWIMLYQLGFTNTKVLMGGFDCFLEDHENCPTTMAKYDYAKIASQGGVKEVEVIKKKSVPKKKKPIPVKKKVKVEDEGGC